jgi:hypothetical protein
MPTPASGHSPLSSSFPDTVAEAEVITKDSQRLGNARHGLNVNNSRSMLFGLDTGAFSNLLAVRAGRQVSKVSSEDSVGVHGVSGAVDKVYSLPSSGPARQLKQQSS